MLYAKSSQDGKMVHTYSAGIKKRKKEIKKKKKETKVE